MCFQNKSNSLDTVKNSTPFMDDTVDDFTTFTYLRGSVWIGNDGQILEFIRAFDVGVRTHVDILNDPGIFNYGTIADLSIKPSF